MFLIHQSNTNMLYYEIIDLNMGINPALYTKPVTGGVVLDYSPQSVVVSKNHPSACYMIVNHPATMTPSVLKLNEDGTVIATPDIPEMQSSGEKKLYAAPDGSIYLLFNKGWTVFVYKLLE